MARILIFGCGDVGIALGRLLAADGHRVYGLRREASAIAKPLIPVAGDVTELTTLEDLPPVDFAFYLVAATGYSDAAYRAAYVDGVRNALVALGKSQGVRRFFFASSTGVYGQWDGAWVDETTPAEPDGFSGRRVLEGELTLASGSFPTTVVRFGGIYGPGRRRLIERVQSGKPCVDDPPQYTNRIHRDDCAGVLRHLMNLKDPESLYLGVDCEPAAECQVMTWIADKLGLAPPQRVPAGAGAVSMQRANKRCRNTRLQASGYRFRYPTFREGYGALLAQRDMQ
jgi:nucleoside-diphosphate-sugar epimerase